MSASNISHTSVLGRMVADDEALEQSRQDLLAGIKEAYQDLDVVWTEEIEEIVMDKTVFTAGIYLRKQAHLQAVKLKAIQLENSGYGAWS